MRLVIVLYFNFFKTVPTGSFRTPFRQPETDKSNWPKLSNHIKNTNSFFYQKLLTNLFGCFIRFADICTVYTIRTTTRTSLAKWPMTDRIVKFKKFWVSTLSKIELGVDIDARFLIYLFCHWTYLIYCLCFYF